MALSVLKGPLKYNVKLTDFGTVFVPDTAMMRTRNILFGLSLIIFQITPAQNISNLKISPLNPSNSNTIFAIATEQFPYSGCQRTSWISNANTNTVMVFSTHQMGMLTAICNFVDTVPIGQLTPGSYVLIFYLLNDQNGQIWDSDTLSFVVSGTTGVKEKSEAKTEVLVYPNPSSDGKYYLEVDLTLKQNRPVVYNLLGEKLSAKQIFENASSLDLSDQPDGLYFLEYGREGTRQRIRLLKLSQGK